MSNCAYCEKEKECRPYGELGEMICFGCAFATPERKAATERAFRTQLEAAGPTAVIGTEAGPFPIEHAKEPRT